MHSSGSARIVRGRTDTQARAENTLDSDALGRLQTLFELLDTWDQKEKVDEK